MRKMALSKLLLALLLCPVLCFAGPRGDGDIDRDLRYEGFHITDDGFLSGYIKNASNKTRNDVRLDMWTTNVAETRIFWRKSLSIGDLAPGARYEVREPYNLDGEDPERIEFKFRAPHKDNFRNK